jgi:hypothetical protein
MHSNVITVTVAESMSMSSVVTVLSTTSRPGVQYRLITDDPHAAGQFTLNPLTGVLTLAHAFAATRTYNLTVQATSGPNVAQAVLLITVTDSNTHAPVFEQQIYEGDIQENMPAGECSSVGVPLILCRRHRGDCVGYEQGARVDCARCGHGY